MLIPNIFTEFQNTPSFHFYCIKVRKIINLPKFGHFFLFSESSVTNKAVKLNIKLTFNIKTEKILSQNKK